MGLFTIIEKEIRIEMQRHNEVMKMIIDKLDRLRGIVKDSPRDKLDDIQRQVTKLKDMMENKP
jgi:hypothetical protein